MLLITVSETEFYDPVKEEFIPVNCTTLKLEHSLYSLYEWEKKWKKPFLETKMTREEFLSYVECMNLTPDVNPEVYKLLTQSDIETIQKYLNDPMTATTFTNRDPNAMNQKKQIITAELVYYMMFSQQIPIECDRWHFNSLMTLIRVCSIKNAPPKKMSKAETMARHKAANAKARARH